MGESDPRAREEHCLLLRAIELTKHRLVGEEVVVCNNVCFEYSIVGYFDLIKRVDYSFLTQRA